MKYRFLLITVFSIISSLVLAQSEIDKLSHDFGDMDETSVRYVDFFIKNKSDKKVYLLRVQKPKDISGREFSYLFDKKFLEPDSSMVVRFHINPLKKGRFKYEIPVFMSDRAEPFNITLRGEVKNMNNDMAMFQSCPNFNQTPNSGNPFDFKLTVKVIDKETRQPIPGSEVSLIRNGLPFDLWKMDRNGYKSKKSPLGYYYFYATKDGYRPNEIGAYVNFKRNVIIIELDQEEVLALNPPPINPPPNPPVNNKPEIPQPPVKDSIPEEEEVIEIEIDITQKIEEEVEKEILKDTTPVVNDVPEKFEDIPKEDFSEKHFKYNNIVFVIDKSGSMKKDGKMDLMKYALNQLTKTLRDGDQIGLVSYADDAEIILETTSGRDKEKINETVADMQAGGLTQGGKGIRMGLKLAYKNFIKNGNNEVIVITDGAFTNDSKDYWKQVKKYRKKGIKLSVVGIKNRKSQEKSMRSVSDHGGGDYIGINKLSDAQLKLIETIRVHSFKH